MSSLKYSILATLYYFDAMDYPLTLVELRRWLWIGELSVAEEENKNFEKKIEELIAEKKIQIQEGLYFLFGRQIIVRTRLERYRLAISKICYARKVLWWISLCPFVRGIAIVNTLGLLNSRQEGDIDCLIICADKYLWAARIFTSGITAMFGLRPRNNCSQDRFCFSFYLSHDKMNLESIALRSNDIINDPYLVYWIASILPIYDSCKEWEIFHETNSWIRAYIKDGNGRLKHSQFCIKDVGIRAVFAFVRLILEKLLSIVRFESLARVVQKKVLPEYLNKALNNNDLGVVLNSAMLKFHTPDRREIIRNEWYNKLRGINL